MSDIMKELRLRKSNMKVDPKAERFWEFHSENPNVYLALVELAKGLKGKGYAGWSIKGLIETVRCRSALEGNYLTEINNNHTAYYARLIMTNEPDLVGFFELRKTDAIAVFGTPVEENP